MDFWEILTLGGTIATIMGAFLTFYALINSKAIKEESRLTREAIKEESRLTRAGLEQSREETKKILDKIAELIVAEGRRPREAMQKL